MFRYEIDDAFDISAPVVKNNSVRDYQYYSYVERNPDLRGGRIELKFDDTSKYYLPCEAYLEVRGRLIQADDNPYVDLNTRNVGFVNNGIMALFSSAQYNIGTTKVESIDKDLDLATTIIGMARYSDDFIKSAGHSMMFAKDTNDHPDMNQFIIRRPRNFANNADADVESMVINDNPEYNAGFAARKKSLNAEGEFSCIIPLSHIFGFCRDVRKVIYGSSQVVVLQRAGTDDLAIWRSGVIPAGKVVLTKLALWMPIITPSEVIETRLLEFMNQSRVPGGGGRSLLSFNEVVTTSTKFTAGGIMTWQLALTKNVAAPRHVFVVLQNANRAEGNNRQERSHMIFDKLGVTQVSLRISNHEEPAEQVIIDYGHNDTGRVYQRLWSFMGRDQNVDTGLQISQVDFNTLYPIYYFSLQHLDLTKHSVVDIKFQANVGGPLVGGEFRATAVMLIDKAMILEGGNGIMRVMDAPIEAL